MCRLHLKQRKTQLYAVHKDIFKIEAYRKLEKKRKKKIHLNTNSTNCSYTNNRVALKMKASA